MRSVVAYILLSAALTATGRVHYLPVENPRIPEEGRVVAVEARVALPEARIGSAKRAGWSLNWGDSVSVVLEFDFSTFVDGVDEPRIIVSCSGLTAELTKGFDCSGGFNTLAVEWGGDGRARVLGGERALTELLELDSLACPSGGELTVTPIAGGHPDIADLMVETDENDFSRLMTDYGDDELTGACLWTYLDRENDPAVARIGGRYLLAQVGDDLVYIGGAQTNAPHWRKGMLKGRLTATPYSGYYHLDWFDATGRRLADDCYAEFSADGVTMTLCFPALDAKMRFSSRGATDVPSVR